MAVSPQDNSIIKLAVWVAAQRLTRFYGCYVDHNPCDYNQHEHKTQDFHPALTSHPRHLPPCESRESVSPPFCRG